MKKTPITIDKCDGTTVSVCAVSSNESITSGSGDRVFNEYERFFGIDLNRDTRDLEPGMKVEVDEVTYTISEVKSSEEFCRVGVKANRLSIPRCEKVKAAILELDHVQGCEAEDVPVPSKTCVDVGVIPAPSSSREIAQGDTSQFSRDVWIFVDDEIAKLIQTGDFIIATVDKSFVPQSVVDVSRPGMMPYVIAKENSWQNQSISNSLKLCCEESLQ